MISALGYGIWKMNKDIEKISSKPPEITIPKKAETKEIDTSDWKTYANEKYGFEVKYPKEWKVKENAPGSIEFSLEKSFFQSAILLDIHNNSKGLSVKDFITQIASKPDEYCGVPFDPESGIPIFVSGVEGLKFGPRCFSDGIILVGYKGFIYMFDGVGGTSEILDRMISTFQFIK